MSKKFKGFIYCITNKVNGKRYVGQTLQKGGVNARWNYHISELNRNKHHSKHLQRAWNKYGKDNFIFEVLHELNFSNQDTLLEALNDLEIMYISIWNLLDVNYGYNIAEGGNGGNKFAGKTDEEMEVIRKRLSELNKGENNGMYGRKHSEETKSKISKKAKGRKLSEETRRKLSKSNKGKHSGKNNAMYGRTGENSPWYGKHHTEETKQQISDTLKGKYTGEANGFYGKHHTEEAKQRMSEAKKGKYTGENSAVSRKVLCIELNKPFDCIADAKKWLGKGDIGNALRKGHKAGGYHWQYVQ